MWTRRVVVLAVLLALAAAAHVNRVMPWMCLQRCNESVADIQSNLAQVKALLPCLSAVSFEHYNLGANGTLVTNSDLYPVGATISALGLETYPMISSWPYPPQFLDWMRQLWQDPAVGASFVRQLRDEAHRFGWTGFQVDWEPTTTATPQDALNYASFLGDLAKRLAPIRILPTVATWNAIWNLTAIAHAHTYRVITMGTYAKTFAGFQQQLTIALKSIPREALGVGVETWEVMDEDFPQRVALMQSLHLKELDIWKSPIPADWLAAVGQFVDEPQCTAAIKKLQARR